MKIKVHHIWLIVVAITIALIASVHLKNESSELSVRQLVFLTIGIDQSKTQDVSQYEIQRASEHFSDIVLSWTKQPAFKEQFDSFAGGELETQGRRLEKQNLLFTIDSPEKSSAEAYVETLDSYIDEYNINTNSGIVLAVTKFSTEELSLNKDRTSIGLILIIFAFLSTLLILWDYANRRRS